MCIKSNILNMSHPSSCLLIASAHVIKELQGQNFKVGSKIKTLSRTVDCASEHMDCFSPYADSTGCVPGVFLIKYIKQKNLQCCLSFTIETSSIYMIVEED